MLLAGIGLEVGRWSTLIPGALSSPCPPAHPRIRNLSKAPHWLCWPPNEREHSPHQLQGPMSQELSTSTSGSNLHSYVVSYVHQCDLRSRPSAFSQVLPSYFDTLTRSSARSTSDLQPPSPTVPTSRLRIEPLAAIPAILPLPCLYTFNLDSDFTRSSLQNHATTARGRSSACIRADSELSQGRDEV